MYGQLRMSVGNSTEDIPERPLNSVSPERTNTVVPYGRYISQKLSPLYDNV